MSDSNTRTIGGKEAMWLLVILFVSKILFADISRYVAHSGNAAYMQTAWCALIALVLFLIAARLSGEEDILEASRRAFGSVGTKAVGAIISALLLLNGGVMLRVYTDIISSIALPDSPDFLIMVFLIGAAAFAAFAGTGTLAAYSFAAGIVLVAALGVILVLNIPNYDLTNIYPLLGGGGDKILTGIGGLDVYGDIFLIFLMASEMKKGTSVKKVGTGAIIIAGAVITLTTFLYILTVPYPSSADFTLPVLEIAFDVNLDVIFQRAEGLFFFLWIFSGFIMIGAYICFAIRSFKSAFRLADRRAVIGVFLVIAASVAMWADLSTLQSGVYGVFYAVFTAIAFALPIVVYGIGKRRGERL